MLKTGEIWRSSVAFDVFSKKTNVRNNDDDQDTIRIRRILPQKWFTVLSSEVILASTYAEASDPIMMEDRLCVSILYEDGIWWAEIPMISFNNYQRIL